MVKLWILNILFLLSACASTDDWRTANRSSSGLSPKPEELNEAIFQIYAARTYSWRGNFGTHPWISWKEIPDKEYTVAHVSGWFARNGGSTVSVSHDEPDRYWFGNKPSLVFEARGQKAERIISHVKMLIENYPFKNEYRIWPGPNSNTFVEHIIRNTPELTVELPPIAIGKDYLTNSFFLDKSPTGTGFQFSIFGILGFTLGLGEGVEINILGLTFGVDILRPALKLPVVGRLGMDDKPL